MDMAAEEQPVPAHAADSDALGGSATQFAEPAPSGVVVRAVDIVKSFGATRALRGASVDFHAGEIHAILGENGSGKSTLVKIVSGVQRPDTGHLEVNGTRIDGFASPSGSMAAGIAAVFQEVLVAPPQSVLDNVFLGTNGLFRERIPRAERERRAREVLTELLGHEPDLHQPVEDLQLSDRQACCIARALVRNARVLILDEATSALDIATRDRLFAILRRECAKGTAVIFISHRMDEIDEIANRITVMRSGVVVGSRMRGEASGDELIQLMIERGIASTAATTDARPARKLGGVVLSAHGLELTSDSAPIDFELHAGELVGLAGLEGHGQDLFLKALWGGSVAGGRVVRVANERGTHLRSPRHAARHGVVFVPRERRLEGLLHEQSIRENFALPTLQRDSRLGWILHRRTQSRFRDYHERLSIKIGQPDDRIETLSGGNQQKVVIARWLAANPAVLLLNDPTRGVDVGAKDDTYELLTALAADGLAVVMLSTEVDEHISLMDRVLVFRENQLSRELTRTELSRDTLIESYFGTQPDARANSQAQAAPKAESVNV
jgi:ribose transport system ATP-binding protein/rhamnose transport system ATP-binding protein